MKRFLKKQACTKYFVLLCCSLFLLKKFFIKLFTQFILTQIGHMHVFPRHKTQGTVMQIGKALINDCLSVSKVS